MKLTIDQVRAGCAWQRELCRKNASPTYVALLTELISRLDTEGDAVTELLTADGQDPVQSALCLRLFGAVNRVAVAESASWLPAYYPTLGGEADVTRVVPAFFDFLEANLAAVREQMSVSVQTNEVGRAAPLSAAMNHVATATGRPLRLLEVGASAGLNLLLDRYFVAAGGTSWGPPDSTLRLVDHFLSGQPPTANLDIAERRGCDLNPIDAHAPESENLLRSFVWPEHVERGHRLDAALTVARSVPKVTLDTADAYTWVSQHLEELPRGQATVVFHSIVLAYFTTDERARFAKLIRTRGAATDADSPLAWISLEPSDEDSSVVQLVCELWPLGRRVVLATTTPHGTQVRWDPQEVAA